MFLMKTISLDAESIVVAGDAYIRPRNLIFKELVEVEAEHSLDYSVQDMYRLATPKEVFEYSLTHLLLSIHIFTAFLSASLLVEEDTFNAF